MAEKPQRLLLHAATVSGATCRSRKRLGTTTILGYCLAPAEMVRRAPVADQYTSTAVTATEAFERCVAVEVAK